MEDYSYMCGECFQFCDNIDNFIHHVCLNNIDNTNAQECRTDLQKRDKIRYACADPGTSEQVTAYTAAVHSGSEPICDQVSKDLPKSTEGYLLNEQEYSDLEGTEDEDLATEGGVKKRKKYQAMADEYRVNRVMRDKDFKLGRTHLYSFKDTLGDWDERSTKLLIHLIQKYPKSHFLLPTRAERRLGHWEGIHQEMEAAGYTFTVLQLRMRWREVLQKYRWTVDYNDNHEIKKKCEYFDEMIELFGDWDREAIQCLFKQMHQLSLENQKKKILRIGYAGWERITAAMNNEGHRFTTDMVEARWRNMVTLYKTMVDHNALPNVEPYEVAYKGDLEKILTYIPKRRQIYEKVKGRSVKMERFPTNGIKTLLQAYKDCIDQFMDPSIKNTSVWDEIKQKLEEEGYDYTTLKLKEILNGIIKGYEKSQLHNSLPGAIRRDVPYYRELSEIYGAHGRWPHVQTSRTKDMRNKRKFRLRLQASQQLWSSEESKALLDIYPDVLESHVNQNVSHQASDLWLQVAKAYANTGFPKRDVPEIAVHIGLLRMGYAQGNLFPFLEEMRKVKETEEAVCYSPDVSKFTGDVEVVYWSHEAVNYLLELYLKHQTSLAKNSSKEEIFAKIRDDMEVLGYRYTKDEIHDHFRTLITQYRTRTSKIWGETASSRKTSNPTCAPYLKVLEKVWQLRRKLSLSWTSGVMPLTDESKNVVYEVACRKAEELFRDPLCTSGKNVIPQLIENIQSHIRTKKLLDDVPRTRQIRLHLASALQLHEGSEENCYIAKLKHLLESNGMDNFLKNLKQQDITVSRKRPHKKKLIARKATDKKLADIESEKLTPEDDFLGNVCPTTVSSGKTSRLVSQLENHSPHDDYTSSILLEGGRSGKAVYIQNIKENDELNVEMSSALKSNERFNGNDRSNSCEFRGTSVCVENTDLKKDDPGLQIVSAETDVKMRKMAGEFGSDMECDESKKKLGKGTHEYCSPSTSSSVVAGVSGSNRHKTTSKRYLESRSENCRTEAETKVIHTRYGRKTRFTFFSRSLNDNFEEESQSANVDEILLRSTEKKDKSTQSYVNFSGKRKRGRPRKPREVDTNVHQTTVSCKDGLIENVDFSNNSNIVNVNEPMKQVEKRGSLMNKAAPTVHCTEVDGEVYLAENASRVDMNTECRSKSDGFNSDNCLSSGIRSALERHEMQRSKKQNEFLAILEKHQSKETIVVHNMIDVFNNLKCMISTKLKS